MFQVGTRTVHPDGHVEVDGAFYSVPHTLVGQQVRAQWDGHLVRLGVVDADGQRQPIAVHLHQRPGRWAEAVVAERGVRAYRLLQGLISLTRSHPRERVNWACRLTLGYRIFRYRTLRRLVEQAAARAAAPALLQQHAIIRDLSVYAQFA